MKDPALQVFTVTRCLIADQGMEPAVNFRSYRSEDRTGDRRRPSCEFDARLGMFHPMMDPALQVFTATRCFQ
jgi:hypothetical protein